jgi:hypothetical protein
VACVNAYYKYLQAQIRQCAPAELTRSRIRLLEQRTRKLKLENDAKEASLTPAEDTQIVCEMLIEAINKSSR